MSAYMNAGDNTCPLVNSIVKIMALGLLFPVGIRGTLTVYKVNILTIVES